MSEAGRKSIPFGRPWITDEDRQAVITVLDGPILTHGPRCHEFEEAFSTFMAGGHSVTTSSCTAAMHLFYMHLGVGPGAQAACYLDAANNNMRRDVSFSAIRIRPQPCELLIFPSYLVHYVEPYSGKIPRITISSNFWFYQ